MSLRCCLVAILLAAVPAFGAGSAADGALRNTQFVPRGTAWATEEAPVVPRRIVRSAAAAITDTYRLLRRAAGASGDRSAGAAHGDDAIGEPAAGSLGEPRRAARPAARRAPSRGGAISTRSTQRFDTRRSPPAASDAGDARSAEVSQSVIRNVAARPGSAPAASAAGGQDALAA